MNADDAFLQAILDAPDDDLPRLLYADWLDEQGDPRGEFIRLQCTRAEWPLMDDRRSALERRERELLALHQNQWAGPLRHYSSGWHFRRGFVDDVRLHTSVFFRRGERLLQGVPVRSLRLRGARWCGRFLAAHPLLGRPAVLQLGEVEYDDLDELAHSPHLGRLRGLVLHEEKIAGVGAILRSEALPSYRELHYLQSFDRGARREALVERCLTESSRDNFCRVIVHPVRGPWTVPQLRTLLASLPRGTLTGLALADLGGGPALALALANCPNLHGLTTLRLAGNRLEDQGAQSLAAVSHLDSLQSLDVADNGLSAIGKNVLRERFGDRVTFGD
jgi:uncharacterized protein (TIGR02996 family)